MGLLAEDPEVAAGEASVRNLLIKRLLFFSIAASPTCRLLVERLAEDPEAAAEKGNSIGGFAFETEASAQEVPWQSPSHKATCAVQTTFCETSD